MIQRHRSWQETFWYSGLLLPSTLDFADPTLVSLALAVEKPVAGVLRLATSLTYGSPDEAQAEETQEYRSVGRSIERVHSQDIVWGYSSISSYFTMPRARRSSRKALCHWNDFGFASFSAVCSPFYTLFVSDVWCGHFCHFLSLVTLWRQPSAAAINIACSQWSTLLKLSLTKILMGKGSERIRVYSNHFAKLSQVHTPC